MTLVLICLLVSGMAAVAPQAEADGTGTVERVLPPDAGCGDRLTVVLEVDPPTGTSAWLLKEHPPDGTTVLEVGPAHNGHVDDNGTISWVSTTGGAAQVQYTIRLPTDTAQPLGPFAGSYRFHPSMSERQTSSGPTELELRCGSVLRVLPQHADCGSTIEVGISLAPPPGTTSWLVDENPPQTVTVGSVDEADSGVHSPDTGTVSWVSTSGGGALKTYAISIPAGIADGTVLTFVGEYRFHPGMTERQAIGGAATLTITCPAADEDDPEDPPTPPDTVPTVDDLTPAAPGAPFVTRFLPQQVRCGETFVVALGIAPPHNTSAWVLVETPPAHLTIGHVDPTNLGEWIAALGVIKWLSVNGSSNVHIYHLSVPNDLSDGSTLTFDGASRAHPDMTERVPVIGHRSVKVACPPPDPTEPPAAPPSGGGGGGGTPQAPPALRLSPPGEGLLQLDAAAVVPPPGALWRAVTPLLSGDEGSAVRIRIPHDENGTELVFEAGTPVEGMTLTITRWHTLPPGVTQLPPAFRTALLISVEVTGAPPKGHVVTWSLAVDRDTLPIPVHAALLAHEESAWSFAALATRSDRDDGSRLLATGPCCSLRVLGFDLERPQIDVRIDEDAGGLYLTSTATDNVGPATVALFHNGTLLAQTDGGVLAHRILRDQLRAGTNSFEVMAVDVTGHSHSSTHTWTHFPVEVANGGVTDPPGGRFGPWLLVLSLVLVGLAVAYTVRQRRTVLVGDKPREPPALTVVATEAPTPAGAEMGRTFTLSGAKGSGANVLLGDDEVPTIAIFLGEPLDEVPVEVSKWPVEAAPEGSLPFSASASPILLLRVVLPDETAGEFPILVTLALPEESLLDPSLVALLTYRDGTWTTADRFRFMLDPDGRYRGSALADDRGWLLVALLPADDAQDDAAPDLDR